MTPDDLAIYFQFLHLHELTNRGRKREGREVFIAFFPSHVLLGVAKISETPLVKILHPY